MAATRPTPPNTPPTPPPQPPTDRSDDATTDMDATPTPVHGTRQSDLTIPTTTIEIALSNFSKCTACRARIPHGTPRISVAHPTNLFVLRYHHHCWPQPHAPPHTLQGWDALPTHTRKHLQSPTHPSTHRVTAHSTSPAPVPTTPSPEPTSPALAPTAPPPGTTRPRSSTPRTTPWDAYPHQRSERGTTHPHPSAHHATPWSAYPRQRSERPWPRRRRTHHTLRNDHHPKPAQPFTPHIPHTVRTHKTAFQPYDTHPPYC